ncbi:cytochrome c [uncultured Neptuniibacter sp.]|uniref:c-type cytochrome n=1 Tax=uncultured Neptuniibacter sp. TaxID=502143 RepID=UPI002603D0F0|nr:cytochrome c [uncultured Neptuniibacter sp.]
MRISAYFVLLFCSLILAGCDRETPPEKMTAGEDIYGYYCKNCHENKGPGANMERFAGKQPMKPYKIILMIKYGFNQDSHSMPLFDQLSEEQADAVARYVVSLQMEHINR